MIRSKTLSLASLALLAAVAAPAVHAAPPGIAAAIADPARPAEDRARDADRKPAEMLRFAGVRPGMTVVDLMPGGGYFTRLFAAAVGPAGTVYAYVPDEMIARNPEKGIQRLNALAEGHPNVKPLHDPLMSPTPPNLADIVWTSQNYHDFHDIPGVDVAAFDKLIYNSLKPGGVFVVLDHAAPAGSGLAATNTTHRIDPATVRAEVTSAGFVYDGESKVLANPADDHTLKVSDPAIRGHTDQFVYRFRKPK